MNTEEIYGYLNCFLSDRDCTFSVIPCDLLRNFKIEKYPLLLVVNSDVSSEPGKHWLALYQADKKCPIIFIDSYGRGIENYNPIFRNFVNSNTSKLIDSDRILQNLISDVCGQYTIYFLYLLYRENGCVGNMYRNFTNDTVANDKFVVNFVKKKTCVLESVFPKSKQCCKKFCEQ